MYKRGDSWYSDFWYKGERYTESHGPVSKSVAKEKDTNFRANVSAGRHKKKKQDPPFDKAIEEHLKKCKVECQESTHIRYIIQARHLKEHYGKRQISSIEGNEILIRKYINKRKSQIKKFQMRRGRTEDEVTYTTINRELSLLRAMFNVLIKAGKATKNPVSLVTLFEEIEKERILTHDEEVKIIQEIEKADCRYHHLKDIIIISLNTGMRQGEILALKEDWIDLKEGIINVPRQAQKRKKKHKRVPINTAVRPIIERLLKQNRDSEYLFISPKTGTRYTSVQNAWNGILKNAGLKGKPGVDKLRLHDLRHTAATNLARAGKDIKFIAQFLGHTDVKTSARYIHYTDEDLEDLKEGAEVLARVPSDFTTLKIARS